MPPSPSASSVLPFSAVLALTVLFSTVSGPEST